MFFCLSLSFCLFECSSTYPLSVFLSICLSGYRLSVFLSFCLSVFMSLCLSVFQSSVCLSVFLSCLTRFPKQRRHKLHSFGPEPDQDAGIGLKDGLDCLTKFVGLFVFLSFYQSVCLVVYLSISLSIYLIVFLSFCLSVFLSFCLSVFLSFCLSFCLSLVSYQVSGAATTRTSFPLVRT
jgi:hypothetical protein